MGKYTSSLYQCNNCDFLQLDKVIWLQEAYRESISITDTGIVARNIDLSRKLLVLLSSISSKSNTNYFVLMFFRLFFKKILSRKLTRFNGKILDFGGGYGLLVRILRDFGLDAYWTDPYSINLFSKGFEGSLKNSYNCIVSFEVLEHLLEPNLHFENILKDRNPQFFIFSTQLYGEQVPEQDWWYFSFLTGQHISFYNQKTLAYIARKFDYQSYSINQNFHIFSKVKLNINLIKFMVERADIFYRYAQDKYESLTWSDYNYVLERLKNESK
ncbi:class I SAM-dependent methyltransferase [Leptospira jelokensis]|uniref:class I SAM-dependent methyltransferase n=1 Tax=Leptospira jelokensis TaxID=2484931 RepID=UPI0014386B98|nr:class I SAM-dependent methyltransferase [Leptospira jelokensis]